MIDILEVEYKDNMHLHFKIIINTLKDAISTLRKQSAYFSTDEITVSYLKYYETYLADKICSIINNKDAYINIKEN
jgi:hypothetical protein